MKHSSLASEVEASQWSQCIWIYNEHTDRWNISQAILSLPSLLMYSAFDAFFSPLLVSREQLKVHFHWSCEWCTQSIPEATSFQNCIEYSYGNNSRQHASLVMTRLPLSLSFSRTHIIRFHIFLLLFALSFFLSSVLPVKNKQWKILFARTFNFHITKKFSQWKSTLSSECYFCVREKLNIKNDRVNGQHFSLSPPSSEWITLTYLYPRDELRTCCLLKSNDAIDCCRVIR